MKLDLDIDDIVRQSVPAGLPPGTAEAAERWLYPTPAPYMDNPQGWIEDVLGEHVWSKQAEICQSVVDNKYTAVKACHGPGKSFIAARIFCWWMNVHVLGDAFGVSSAPSWPQVQAILWREIRRAWLKGKLPGRITQECQWHMGDGRSSEELIAMGRKPADYNEHAFQGLHARFILVVLDEACGIPVSLWTAVKTLLTNDNARLLAIGNPDDPGAEFKKFCDSPDVNTISISAYETPNFTGEWVPDEVAENLVTPGWVDEREREWGTESPLFVSKVLAEFPDVSDQYLFPPSIIQTGILTDLPGIDSGRYGADISRFGTDKSVVYRNRGGQIRFEDSWGMLDTMKTTGNLVKIMQRHHRVSPVPMNIDTIGIGAGVYDRMREQGYDVSPFTGSERAYRPDKFQNRRAEEYWRLRTEMERGDIDIDPYDLRLQTQLQSIKYWFNSSGKLQIESKEDMRDRGVPSPDHADAAVYSNVRTPRLAIAKLPGSHAEDLLRMEM